MQREIKFRGKSKVTGEWIDGYYYVGSAPLQCIGEPGEDKHYIIYAGFADWNMPRMHQVEVTPETVGQFTGLYDDNGEEIYKGHLVEIQDRCETKTPYVSEVYITYDGVLVDAHPAHIKMGEGRKRLLSHYCDYGFGGKYDVSCKIVGDVYER